MIISNFSNVVWYLMHTSDIKDLWSPTVYMGHAENVKKFDSLGEDKISYLWFEYSKKMLHFSEIFSAKVPCELNFDSYPFDSHTCKLQIKVA